MGNITWYFNVNDVIGLVLIIICIIVALIITFIEYVRGKK